MIRQNMQGVRYGRVSEASIWRARMHGCTDSCDIIAFASSTFSHSPTSPDVDYDGALSAAMAYIAPIHRASSVRHAIKLNFFSDGETHVAVA
jgi:hypothetical protein